MQILSIRSMDYKTRDAYGDIANKIYSDFGIYKNSLVERLQRGLSDQDLLYVQLLMSDIINGRPDDKKGIQYTVLEIYNHIVKSGEV